jgi:hypothetical protein
MRKLNESVLKMSINEIAEFAVRENPEHGFNETLITKVGVALLAEKLGASPKHIKQFVKFRDANDRRIKKAYGYVPADGMSYMMSDPEKDLIEANVPQIERVKCGIIESFGSRVFVTQETKKVPDGLYHTEHKLHPEADAIFNAA